MTINNDDYEDYGMLPEGFSYSKESGLQLTNQSGISITIDPNAFTENTSVFMSAKLNPNLYNEGGIQTASDMDETFWSTVDVFTIPKAIETTYSISGSSLSGTLEGSNISGTVATSVIPSLDAAKITSGTFETDRIPTLSAEKIEGGVGIKNASEMTGTFWDSDLKITEGYGIKIQDGATQNSTLQCSIASSGMEVLLETDDGYSISSNLSCDSLKYYDTSVSTTSYLSEFGSNQITLGGVECWDSSNSRFYNTVAGIFAASEMVDDFWDSDLVLKSGKSLTLSGGGLININTGGGQGNMTISTATGIKARTGGYDYGIYWDWNYGFTIRFPTVSYYSGGFVALNSSTQTASQTIPSYCLPSNVVDETSTEMPRKLDIHYFDLNDQNGTAKLKKGIVLEEPLPETIYDPHSDRIYSVIKED